MAAKKKASKKLRKSKSLKKVKSLIVAHDQLPAVQ
jgi:hypothetical protein